MKVRVVFPDGSEIQFDLQSFCIEQNLLTVRAVDERKRKKGRQ